MRSAILFLPLLAALGAFTLPAARVGVRQSVQTLFVPVAYPARVMGVAVRNALSPPEPIDYLNADRPLTAEQLRQQNAALIAQISNLRAILKDLEQLSHQYRTLGTDLRTLVEPATVIGGPSDQRQKLTLATTGLSKVPRGAAVISGFEYVGRIDSVGVAGESASVLLPTDPASKVDARFTRPQPRADGGIDIINLDLPEPLVEGTGSALVARLLPPEPIEKKLRVGDLVVLDQKAFGKQLAGVLVGRVSRIDIPPHGAGHAEVQIEPSVNYLTLPEVLVVTK